MVTLNTEASAKTQEEYLDDKKNMLKNPYSKHYEYLCETFKFSK